MLRAINICLEIVSHMVSNFNKKWGDKYILDRIHAMKDLAVAFSKYGGFLGKIAQILCVDMEGSDVFDQCIPVNSEFSTEYVHGELMYNPIYVNRLVLDREMYRSGSLGQVYKGKLDGTTDVILKVQYRNIRETFDQDFLVVGFLMKYICSMGHLINCIEDAKKMSEAELDYTNEMNNQLTITEIFKDTQTIHVPRIYPDMCTKETIVMEYMSDFKSMKEFIETATTEDKSVVGNHILRFVMELLIGHGIYYSDNHFGNFLVNDKNELCVLDFGCLEKYDETRHQHVKNLIKTGCDEDKDACIQAYTDIGVLDDEMSQESRDYIYTMTETITRPFRKPGFKFTAEYCHEVAYTEVDLMEEWKLPSGLIYLQKIPWGLFNLLARLETTVTCMEDIHDRYLKV